MTKEHIQKIINNNRRGFAAHQLWVEFNAESDRRDKSEAEVIGKLTKELTAQIADRKNLQGQIATLRELRTYDATIIKELSQAQATLVAALQLLRKKDISERAKILIDAALNPRNSSPPDDGN